MAGVKKIKTERFTMDYCSFGKGEKNFVIIPGISIKSVMYSYLMLREAFAAFREDYTVYVFERKRNITAPYSVREMAEDTFEAMKELEIEKADIFGASQGGMIAQEIAINHPEIVNSLVLGSTLSRPNATFNKTLSLWTAEGVNMSPAAICRKFSSMIYSPATLEKMGSKLYALARTVTAKEVERFVTIALGCVGFDTFDRLDLIQCPVLVLGAGKDKVVGAEGSLEIAEKLGCEYYIYEDYAHAVYDEAPDYRKRMLEFIRSH